MNKMTALLAGVLLISFVGCSGSKKETTTSPITWKTVYYEDFEEAHTPAAAQWLVDQPDEEDRFEDAGAYFKYKVKEFKAEGGTPSAFRNRFNLGQDDWLQVESYSRSSQTALRDQVAVVADPEDGANQVLRIGSPQHTDGTILRSAQELPEEYRVCARVGHASFGDGIPGTLNGYDSGDEMALPWIDYSSVKENGFYWLAILDAEPRPRNNVWIHHHRKAVIDSDNNQDQWTRIWNGEEFVKSGEHPVMMFVLDRDNATYTWNYDRTGQPFISIANGEWNSEAETKEIRAADSYRDQTWYEVCIAKYDGQYHLRAEGDFVHGGQQVYEGSIEFDRVYEATTKPDYFMLGEPHTNFYEGEVYYDNIRLEVPVRTTAVTE